jgi:hypothetical protein
MWTFLARSQYNSPILNIRVQWVTRTNIESATEGSWKYDLPLGRDFSLQGKTILLLVEGLQRLQGCNTAHQIESYPPNRQ